MAGFSINHIFKTTLIAGALVASLFVTSHTYSAGNSSCQVIYGGGEVCPPSLKFSVDKLVQRPGKGGEFVDNITINDPKYGPNQQVTFKIKIQNTGDKAIEKLDVTDTLPEHLSFVSGPGKQENKKITFTIENLDPGKTQEVTMVAKTAEEKNLPSDRGIICGETVTNRIKAVEKNGSEAQDRSEVCIEKKVLGAVPAPQVFKTPPMKVTPPTGPEILALPFLASLGAVGMYLRKKSSK